MLEVSSAARYPGTFLELNLYSRRYLNLGTGTFEADTDLLDSWRYSCTYPVPCAAKFAKVRILNLVRFPTRASTVHVPIVVEQPGFQWYQHPNFDDSCTRSTCPAVPAGTCISTLKYSSIYPKYSSTLKLTSVRANGTVHVLKHFDVLEYPDTWR